MSSIISDDVFQKLRQCGPAGLVHRATEEDSCYVQFKLGSLHAPKEPSSYYTLIKQILKEHLRLNGLFGKHYDLEGIFGYNPVYRPPIYTLSFEGIRRALDLLQVQAVVALSFEQLREAFATLRGRQCLVCDGGFLMQDNRGRGHSISLFVENAEGGFRLCINDSYGIFAAYKQENFQTLFPEGVEVDLCASRVERQEIGEPTCNVYAIEDCVAFQKDPDLIEKVFEGKGRSLPSSMMTFAKENRSAALERAIEHQILVMSEGLVSADYTETT